MTDAIGPTTPTALTPATPPGSSSPVQVAVSRAAAAPIYVYRVTDTATGRTLVEIPTGQTKDPDAPGGQIDEKV